MGKGRPPPASLGLRSMTSTGGDDGGRKKRERGGGRVLGAAPSPSGGGGRKFAAILYNVWVHKYESEKHS
jgi:hypothetical protein